MFGLNPIEQSALRFAGRAGEKALPAFKGLGLPGLFKSGLLGAGIGGITGLAKGDNYDSTSTFRNFSSGALAGGAIGIGARLSLSNLIGSVGHLTGAKQAIGAARGAKFAAFKSAPLPRLAMAGTNTAAKVANAAMKVGGFLGRNPGLAIGGAAVVGGGVYAMNQMYPGRSGNDFESSDYQESQRQFQASAESLTFGLHANRHRRG
jgi:hypothetical protein